MRFIYLFLPLGEKQSTFIIPRLFHTNRSIVKDIILLFYQMTITVSIPIKVQSVTHYIFHHIWDISPGLGYMLTAYVNSSVFMGYQQDGSRHDT